MSVLLNYQTSR